MSLRRVTLSVPPSRILGSDRPERSQALPTFNDENGILTTYKRVCVPCSLRGQGSMRGDASPAARLTTLEDSYTLRPCRSSHNCVVVAASSWPSQFCVSSYRLRLHANVDKLPTFNTTEWSVAMKLFASFLALSFSILPTAFALPLSPSSGSSVAGIWQGYATVREQQVPITLRILGSGSNLQVDFLNGPVNHPDVTHFLPSPLMARI